MSPIDIVAHRVLWSLPFLAVLITASKGWRKVRMAARYPRTIAMLTLTATFDHRAVDGAPAAEFLQTVKQLLEEPALML